MHSEWKGLKPKKGHNFIEPYDEEVTPSGIVLARGGNSEFIRPFNPIGKVFSGQYEGKEVVFNRMNSDPIMLLDAQNRHITILSVEDRDIIAVLEERQV